MTKLIGIPGVYRQDFPTGIYQVGCDYVDSVALAGGVPLMLPMTGDRERIAAYADLIGALVLTGGGDVDPALYGEEQHEKTGYVSKERDAFEIALLTAMVARNKPVFGICRGMQIMNVAFGGSLYQDILEQVPGAAQHVGDMHNRPEEFHEISLAEGSIIRERMGAPVVKTNSFHHQAVKKLAPGFTATAFSRDGVIESIEAKEKQLFAVEFHPENMTKPFPIFIRLFSWAVDLCK